MAGLYCVMGLSLSMYERGRVLDMLNVDGQVSRVDVRGKG